MYKVVITDYYYPNLDEERKVFKNTGIEIIDCKGKCNNEEDVIKYTKNVDAIITQFVPITKKVIGNLTNCKIVVRYAIGLDNIDIAEATKKKIMVANVPDYCIEEVSNQALSLMLAVLRKLTIADRETRKGNWSYENTKPLYRLSKMNLGIIAFGKIAREFVKKAEVLVVVAGMEGALASVVSGMVKKPVIGVPTSVGYGASFSGLAPLLTMLNSCSPEVSVVNIDNGFGAGYLAGLINK